MSRDERRWTVSVSLDGEMLVTIASDYICGKPEFTEVESDVVRDAARNLEAFIGKPSSQAAETPREVDGADDVK